MLVWINCDSCQITTIKSNREWQYKSRMHTRDCVRQQDGVLGSDHLRHNDNSSDICVPSTTPATFAVPESRQVWPTLSPAHWSRSLPSQSPHFAVSPIFTAFTITLYVCSETRKRHVRLINKDNLHYRRCHTLKCHLQVIKQMRTQPDQVPSEDDRMIR